MKIEYTPKSLDDKFEVGDVFKFLLTNPKLKNGGDYSNLSGSALISDYHSDKNEFDIIIWDYRGVPLATVGKGAIMGITEAGKAGLMSGDGISEYKVFGVTGAHVDQNFLDFRDKIVDDLEVKEDKVSIFFIILEVAASNMLTMLQSNGSPLKIKKDGGIEVSTKKE